MSHPLDGCRAKLDRVDKQLSGLEALVSRAILKSGSIAKEDDVQTGKPVARIRDQVAPDLVISVLIGEIAYNLRSCLDHLMRQMLKPSAGTDESNADFPIFDDRAAYGDLFVIKPNGKPLKGRESLVSLPPAFVAPLNSLQPHSAPQPHEHPLWVLRWINDVDKHRLLHLTRAQGRTVAFPTWPGPGPMRAFVSAPVELYEGADVSAISELLSHPDVESDLIRDIAFGEPACPAFEKPVLQVMRDIRAYVRKDVFAKPGILDGFAPCPPFFT
jgi:hypothetical protein